MPICRLIYRLDFKVNFDIIDKPGGILRLLDSTTYGLEHEKFFNQIGEKVDNRLIEASANERDVEVPGWARRIGVKPESIDVNIENATGIDVAEMEEYADLKKLIKVTDIIRKEYNISELMRAGLRIYYFVKIGDETSKILQGFKKIIGSAFSEETENVLGIFTDCGIVIDGSHDDKIQYHFRCGPYWTDESKKKKYLSLDIDNFKNEFNVIMDLDLYETNFTLNETVSFAKWCKPHFVKIQNLISNFEKRLEKSIAQNGNIGG